MKKLFLILNLLLCGAVFVGNYFYLTQGGLLLKGLCSGGFALLGVLNLCYALIRRQKSPVFHGAMAVGLIFCMLGDILLGFDFILGASLFAFGHVCYFAAQCTLLRFQPMDALFSGVLFAGAGSFLLFCPLLTFDAPVMRYVCLVYALIISCMAGKALSDVIRKPSALTVILALGSALFFFSDLMLVFDWFIGLWDHTGLLCMATYYPAQCLLAFAGYGKANR